MGEKEGRKRKPGTPGPEDSDQTWDEEEGGSRGPEPHERLKGEGDWVETVKKAIDKKKPPRRSWKALNTGA